MTLAARDGGSSRGLAAVMMRHGSSPVSVGAVRPPDAPAEPPSVAAGNLQGCAYLQASVRTLPGHARPGRRHIFSPAGYSHGQRPTVVNATFASLHRLSVQQSRVQTWVEPRLPRGWHGSLRLHLLDGRLLRLEVRRVLR